MRSGQSESGIRLTIQRIGQVFEPVSLPSILFVIFLVIIGVSTSTSFLGGFNVSNVLVQVTPLILLALGQALAVGSGGIDLSVGSIASLSAVTTASLLVPLGAPMAIGIAMAVALAAGFLNGALIAYGLEPFLVTLATLSIFQGIAFLIQPVPGGVVPDWFTAIAQFWNNIPYALPIVILLAIACAFIVRKTQTGSDLLAVGGNIEIARMLGVRIEWTLIKTYMIVALFAGLAGMFLAARTGIGDPTIGARFALDSLAAVVVGGTLLAGGRLSVLGAVFGALALGLVPNVMNLAGVPTFFQTAVKGLILIAAILVPVILARAVVQRRRTARARLAVASIGTRE